MTSRSFLASSIVIGGIFGADGESQARMAAAALSSMRLLVIPDGHGINKN